MKPFELIPIKYCGEDSADFVESSTIKEFVRSGLDITNVVYAKIDALPKLQSTNPEFNLKLKGSVKFQPSSKRWVFTVMLKGKVINHFAKITKKRTDTQAKNICIEAQLKYSLYGESYRDHMVEESCPLSDLLSSSSDTASSSSTDTGDVATN